MIGWEQNWKNWPIKKESIVKHGIKLAPCLSEENIPGGSLRRGSPRMPLHKHSPPPPKRRKHAKASARDIR